MNGTWLLRSRDAATKGLESARCLTAGGLERVLVHASPAQMSVEVVDQEHHLVASGEADRHGDYSPMTEMMIADRNERREVWPAEERHGPAELLPGGEMHARHVVPRRR